MLNRWSRPIVLVLSAAIVLLVQVPLAFASASTAPKVDTVEFFPGGAYLTDVPHPNDFLQHPLGELPARYYEIENYIKAVAEASGRVMLEEHGQTFEGRTLYHLVITSEKNMARIDELKNDFALLADPYAAGSSEVLARVDDLPACAWLGYSIHGDELSGVDASLMLIYQLAAGTDPLTLKILDNVVTVVDPIENPDGRSRYLPMLETFGTAVPNYDPSAMQHNGVWPWGRTNHYLFDLNRDWILATQPETRGRLATQLAWHPHLVVDAHEMGPNGSFLQDPPREPINQNTPDNVLKWWKVFSTDNVGAFGERGWSAYIEDWHDQWYPGYGSAWPTFSGTIGILYEQARVDGEMIEQSDGYMLTFHEAVNHQFTSSVSNLTTLADNRAEILRDYYNTRKGIVDRGRRTFVFPPDEDELKMNRFIGSLLDQGIKVKRAKEAFTVGRGIDRSGQTVSGRRFPAGTYLVTTAQPMGALANAELEFDTRLPGEFLKEERRELEKYGDTRMYEVSAWSVPLAYDLDAIITESAISVSSDPVTAPPTVSPSVFTNREADFGYVIDMVGEKTYRLLARLFEAGLIVRASERSFTVGGHDFQAGSLVLKRRGNPDDMPEVLAEAANEIGINVYGVSTAATDRGSWFGSSSFQMLREPRIGLVIGDGIDYTDLAAVWFVLDQEVAMEHSLIWASSLGREDLSRYNVLIIPGSWGRWFANLVGPQGARNIAGWVGDGGTLICAGEAAVWACDTANGLSSARLKRDVLGELDRYNSLLERSLAAEAPVVDTMALYHPDKVPPTSEAAAEKPGKPGGVDPEQDAWARRFHPRGVIMRAEIDTTDWLAFGMGTEVPVMTYADFAFVTDESVTTTVRYSVDPNRLRMSGLLWPEARERWAGTAYAMHESNGKGQTILFAGCPNVRAYWWGTRQMFLNAVLYGPGMGSRGEPYAEEQSH